MLANRKFFLWYFLLNLGLYFQGFAQNWNAKSLVVDSLYNKGNFDSSLVLVDNTLQELVQYNLTNDSTYGIWLAKKAKIYANLGKYDKALEAGLEAFNNIKKTMGEKNSEFRSILGDLAVIYTLMGNFEKALPLAKKNLILTEQIFGKDQSEYGVALNNLAVLYEKLGLYEDALPLHFSAMENLKKTKRTNNQDYGLRLNNLAVVYDYLGKYEKALPLFKEALENCEQKLGKNRSEYGAHLNNLGNFYSKVGQYELAEKILQESLENCLMTLGEGHSDYSRRLSNLGVLYDRSLQLDKAYELNLKALEVCERTVGKNHPDYGIRLSNLSVTLEKKGNLVDALKYGEEALMHCEQVLGKAHPEYGTRLANLGVIYFRLDNFPKAEELFQLSLLNIESTLGKDHPKFGTRLINLANLYYKNGQKDKALALLEESYQNRLLNIKRNFSFMSESAKLGYLGSIKKYYDQYVSCLYQSYDEKPSVAAKIYDQELILKGLVLYSVQAERRTFELTKDSVLLDNYHNLKVMRGLLSKEYSKPIAKRRKDLQTLEIKAEDLETNLTLKSPSFKDFSKQFDYSYKDIQAKLESRDAAVEFITFNYFNGKKYTDSTFYAAIVLKKEDLNPSLIVLCEEKQLLNYSYNRELYDLIWKPIEQHLRDVKHVYYAPSGQLHQISFAALPLGQDSLLSDKYQLEQVSTTAMLLKENAFKNYTASTITLFGGIQYDASPEDLNKLVSNDSTQNDLASRALPEGLKRDGQIQYLPGTLSESKTIAELAAKKKMTVNSYYGLNAAEENYKRIDKQTSPDILHIATHGFFFPDPKINLKELNRMDETAQQTYRASEDPLNRAGLLFAGCNNAWQGKPVKGLEDGILTAYEVSNVSLSNTKLVTLSACETGLGDVKGSEGVFGLQRAFKMAGADYLLMSLWKVPDKETEEFMLLFYKTWFNGKPIQEAFWDSQKEMKKRYPTQYYKWAAFVLVR